MKSDNKKDNNQKTNGFNLKHLKIKKIRLTHSVNKKMVDNRLKKTLKENKSIYLEEKNKNNFPFKRKLILKPTPFQVNKKIKFLNSVKQINKNIKNLVLSSNSRSSNNINNKQNSQFKKIIKRNKETNKKNHSLLRERISKMKKCYKNNSFNMTSFKIGVDKINIVIQLLLII
jgi:hypothetical protein